MMPCLIDWSYWRDKRCCVCGQAADCAVRDAHQVQAPVGADAKDLYLVPGMVAYYCHAHKRPAVNFMLDGSVQKV